MNFFDAHCHLQDERIYGDVDTIVEEASNAGVTGFLCCGTGVADWDHVAGIAQRFSTVVPAFGIHPWFADPLPGDWLTRLGDYVETQSAAIGEIGLDMKLSKVPYEIQETVFVAQMELARDLKCPVSIHCLKAWQYLLPLLKKYRHPTVPILLHSYNGGPAMVEQLAELGCYFSFSGSLTRTRNKKARQSVVNVPLHRLLIETDAPDIPPEINGEIDFEHPNKPSTLPLVFDSVVELLKVEPHVLQEQLYNNIRMFLGDLADKYSIQFQPVGDQ